MASTRPPRGDGTISSTPEDAGYNEDTKSHYGVEGIIYCVFPKPHIVLHNTVHDRNNKVIDWGGLVPSLQNTEARVSGFPSEVSLNLPDFMNKLGLDVHTIPEDAGRAWLLHMYVLSRSKCMLVHLDMGYNIPEITLANMANIPVVGVSERYNIHPCIRNSIDVIVNPVVKRIQQVVLSVAND